MKREWTFYILWATKYLSKFGSKTQKLRLVNLRQVVFPKNICFRIEYVVDEFWRLCNWVCEFWNMNKNVQDLSITQSTDIVSLWYVGESVNFRSWNNCFYFLRPLSGSRLIIWDVMHLFLEKSHRHGALFVRLLFCFDKTRLRLIVGTNHKKTLLILPNFHHQHS